MFTAFGFVFPFLPLFISELGVGDVQQVEIWSGVSSFSQALVLSICSPIWGAVADRRGRRLMVLRAAFGGGVIIGLMGLTQNIWQFMGLRLIQGAMTGVVAAASALAISFVPRSRVGTALGMIQMASFAGNTVGPSLGGFTADHFGYRPSFAVSGALFLIAGVLTILFVSEKFVPAAPLGGDVAVVMTSAGATIKTSALEAGVEALSVTITVKLYVPTVVGVPLRNPLLASSVSPGGSWLPGATNHR